MNLERCIIFSLCTIVPFSIVYFIQIYTHRKAINIKVVHMATLMPEYLVEPNGNLTLPCYDYDQNLSRIPQVSWTRNGILVPHSSVLSNGSLHIKK